MVTVTFYNLLRSQYGVTTLTVPPGTLREIMQHILNEVPHLPEAALHQAVLFVNQQKVMHLKRLDTVVEAGDRLVFTNFVGGG